MNQIGAWGATRAKRDFAHRVVWFCIDELMPRYSTLGICIDLCEDDMDNCDGYCQCIDKREFNLLIDSRLKGDDFISAVCHEMVHVKQYASGKLKNKGIDHYWNGELIPSNYTTVEEYLALPWEQEAYEMQEILTKRYKRMKKTSQDPV